MILSACFLLYILVNWFNMKWDIMPKCGICCVCKWLKISSNKSDNHSVTKLQGGRATKPCHFSFCEIMLAACPGSCKTLTWMPACRGGDHHHSRHHRHHHHRHRGGEVGHACPGSLHTLPHPLSYMIM